MTEIRRADPAARRRAFGLLLIGTLAGALLLAALERYRAPLRGWLVSEPRGTAQRIRLVLLLMAILLAAPVLAFAIHYWRLGATVLRTGQFPPPGYLVIRDTPFLKGPAAVWRGRVFRFLAIALGGAATALCLLLWRLARMLPSGAG